MQYLLMIYQNEEILANMPMEQKGQLWQKYFAFNKEAGASGNLLGGEPLEPVATATTVRVRDGKLTTVDGPFAETKEQLGGYYLVEAKDLDEAVGLAAKIPSVEFGAIEVRPIMAINK